MRFEHILLLSVAFLSMFNFLNFAYSLENFEKVSNELFVRYNYNPFSNQNESIQILSAKNLSDQQSLS